MSHKQVLQSIIAVILAMLFLVGCGGSAPTAVSEAPAATSAPEQSAATPTPEPPADTPTPEPPTATLIPPTATPVPPTPTPEPPTATPTPEPPTATPTPAASMVKGKLVGADSQKPLAGGEVMLCLISAETQCTLQTDLLATVQENGSFELADVSPGQYAVLYAPSGEFESTWKDLDGLALDYKLTNNDFGQEFKSTFGVVGLEYLNLAIGPKGIQSGAVASPKYGLRLQFQDGAPITLAVEQGQPAEIEIKAVGL